MIIKQTLKHLKRLYNFASTNKGKVHGEKKREIMSKSFIIITPDFYFFFLCSLSTQLSPLIHISTMATCLILFKPSKLNISKLSCETKCPQKNAFSYIPLRCPNLMSSRYMDQWRRLHPSGHSTQWVFLHPQRGPVPSEQGHVRDWTGTHALQHPGDSTVQRGTVGWGVGKFVTGSR